MVKPPKFPVWLCFTWNFLQLTNWLWFLAGSQQSCLWPTICAKMSKLLSDQLELVTSKKLVLITFCAQFSQLLAHWLQRIISINTDHQNLPGDNRLPNSGSASSCCSIWILLFIVGFLHPNVWPSAINFNYLDMMKLSHFTYLLDESVRWTDLTCSC